MTSDPYVPGSNITSRLWQLAVGSGIIMAIGAMVDAERIWLNLLLVGFYLLTLSLGGLVMVALLYVTGAGWSVAFRRVPEAMGGTIFWAGLLMLAVVLPHVDRYTWHHHGHGDAGTYWFKELWLQPTFFAVRAVGYMVVWFLLGRAILGVSRRQDRVGGTQLTRLGTGLSALFLLVFAVTISGASVDWILALEPMWFSTMWGVYHFSGMISATVAVVVILAISLRRRGPLRGVFTDEHLHDLGKLLFGFACFWMYIWFCQYMLIWYTAIPEETIYFIRRSEGAWQPLMLANVALNWIVPFFLLLPRPCKRSEKVMLKVAGIVLVGRWLDLYMMIFPSADRSPWIGVWEFAAAAALLGVFGLLFFRAFSQAAPVPLRDPLLSESLHHHV